MAAKAKKVPAKKAPAKKPPAKPPADEPANGSPRARAEAAMRAREPLTAAAVKTIASTLADIAREQPEPLSVYAQAEQSGAVRSNQLVDPLLIEVCLSLAIPLEIPSGDPHDLVFWLYSWDKRGGDPLDELRRVDAHPFFGQVLAASFKPNRNTKEYVGNWLSRAAAIDGGFHSVFAWLDAYGEAMLDTWTVGALETHQKWIENVCQPAVFARCPRLASAIRALTPARLLRNQLRAGVLDEWGWPAHDEALAKFPPERQQRVVWTSYSGPMPYGVLLDTEGGRVVAFGPDGIVLDRELPAAKEMKDVRVLSYAENDVWIGEYHPYQSRWAFSTEPLKADPYGVFDIGCDGALIGTAGKVFHAGEGKLELSPLVGGRRAWFDGERYYQRAQECVVRADGTPIGKPELCFTFDPQTGKKTGHALPAWMAKLLGDDGLLICHIDATFTCAVPPGGEQSPLGAKDGLGGYALYARDGAERAAGIDGRSANGLVNGLRVAALMTFPGREGFYPVVQSAFDIGVAMPDGTTPLVPAGAIAGYWGGTPPVPHKPPVLFPHHWHMLRPRQPAASKALAACTDEQAAAIFAAAAPPPAPSETVTQYKNMQVVATSAERPPTATDALRAAIALVLPAVTHPRIVDGVAALARIANRHAPILGRMKSRVTTTTMASAAKSSLRNDEAAAMSRLFAHDRHWWVENLGSQLGQQILDVSQFLYGAHDDRMVTPAPTVVPWPLLLTHLGEVLYRVLAPGTPKARRAELVKVLELWLQTEFPAQRERTRLVQFSLPASTEEIAGLDREHRQLLVSWDHPFFVQWTGAKDGRVSLNAVEARTGGEFRLPSGAELASEQPVEQRFDAAAIRKTLALLSERGSLPLDDAALAVLTASTGLSRTGAILLWSAGYEPWLLGDVKLERFRIERDSIDPAEIEIRQLPFAEIYKQAMPDDPAELYDGAKMADRLTSAVANVRNSRSTN